VALGAEASRTAYTQSASRTTNTSPFLPRAQIWSAA
jgi:hypothetical protein